MDTDNHTRPRPDPFQRDVRMGLTAYPKYLFSKYIYDERGDALFQQIMDLPEYYLTRAEYDLLESHSSGIADIFEDPSGFDLIELGAGDGKKTRILLKELLVRNSVFSYIPVDISQNALHKLTRELQRDLPELEVKPRQGMYFEVLHHLNTYKSRKKVVMLLGSNIGNLMHDKAIDFLKKLGESLNPNDILFMGFDQKKDPGTILRAYSDSQGVTAEFNKNLLVRINRELQGNFDIDKFEHWECYDPETGTAKSYLVATCPMEVHIAKLDLTILLDSWETIHTEISQKYDDRTVTWLAKQARLDIDRTFESPDKGYKNYIFKKK